MPENENIIKQFGHEVVKTTKELATARNGIGHFAKQLESQMNFFRGTLAPFSQVQEAAAELAKSMGLASKSIMANAQRMVAANKQLSLSMSYNISNEEMFRMQQNIAAQLGRNVAIDMYGSIQKNERGEIVRNVNDSELENLVAASKVFGDEAVTSMVAGFDRIGKSMSSAAKTTGKMFKEAGQYGINLGKYTKNFVNNLEKVQTYNFRNGIDGLREMARKATEIRQEMSQVYQFADKVGSVTGAVETAANLQVLGGSFAGLANPLAMLNESLTNVEGLQDRFNKMTQGMATYNSVTRQIEMNPLDRLRIKRAAEAMGVDANNMIDQAYAQARRSEIQNQMQGMGFSNAEVTKLLPNVGEIDSETGLAGATIGGQFRTLGEIAASGELQQQLVDESRSEGEDIKMIAKSVMSMEDMLKGREKQTENQAALNAIRETAFGASQWDLAIKTITEGYNNKFIEAIGQVDFLTQGQLNAIQTVAYEALDKLIQPISALPDKEEFHQMLTDTMQREFGEGPISTAMSNIANGLSEAVLSMVEGISNYVADVTENATGQKVDVWGALGNKAPAGMAEFTQLTPLASQTNNVQNQEILKGLEAPVTGNTPSFIIKTPDEVGPEIKKEWTVTANEATMTAARVTPTPQGSTQTTETGPKETKHDVNLNFGGTLQLEIKGDDGKILNIENLLENKTFHDSLMRELSRQITEQIQKMDANGLYLNN